MNATCGKPLAELPAGVDKAVAKALLTTKEAASVGSVAAARSGLDSLKSQSSGLIDSAQAEKWETSTLVIRLSEKDLDTKFSTLGAKAQSPDLRKLLFFNDNSPGSLDSLLTRHDPHFDNVATAADDVALIAFTSGTTGVPKGTLHFHRDVLAICDVLSRQVIAPGPQDVFIGTPPLAFTFGLGGQEFKEVRHFRRHPLLTALGNGILAEVDAPRGHLEFGHHAEELATAAADVEDIRAALEVLAVDFLVPPHVLFRSTEAFRETGIIELRDPGGGGGNGLHHRLHHRRDRRVALPDQPKFGVDHSVIISPRSGEIFRKLLLDVQVGTVQGAQVISVLPLHHVAEIRLHLIDAMLEGSLQIGGSAEELDFVRCQLFLPATPPFDPMRPHVFEFAGFRLQQVDRKSVV